MSEKVVAVYEIAVTEPEFKAVEYIEATNVKEADVYASQKYGENVMVEFCTKRRVPSDTTLPRPVNKPNLNVNTLGAYLRNEVPVNTKVDAQED